MNSLIDTLKCASQEKILVGCGISSHLNCSGSTNDFHAPHFLLNGNFSFYKGSQHLTFDRRKVAIHGLDNLLHKNHSDSRGELEAEAQKLVQDGLISQIPRSSKQKHHQVLIDCSWAANYYHFNIDVLGKVMVTSKFLNLTDCEFILNCWRPFQREVLTLSGLSYRWVGYDSILSGSIFVPSLAGTSGAPPLETLRFVRSLIKDPEPTGTGKYIYISRAKSKRKILNEESLLEAMQQYAPFEKVILDGMPVSDQIGIFRNAEIVVGSHGAGLVNCLHMKNPLGVFEIFGSKYQASMFRNICKELRITYGCTGTDSDLLSAGQSTGWDEDYFVDIQAVIHDLEKFMSSIV